MPLKPTGIGYDDDLSVTRAKPASTPGVGSKYRDPIRGRQPDSFFAVGDQYGQDISAKLDRDAAKRRNGANGR